MENIIESKQIIADAKNIYLIPSQEPEAITSTLALFYTLKELNKNVNLIIDTLPDLIMQNHSESQRAVLNLKFLAPSLDFISYPKNFVISVPNTVAQISQVYYEKNNDALKIHLTLEGGNIKKDNIAFYFSEAKPDLIITIGIKDYQKELSGKLNSFGFLLDSPVLNIDSSPLAKGERVDTSTSPVQVNKKFGKINLLGENSLSEITFNLIENIYPVKSVDEVGGVSPEAKQFDGVNPVKSALQSETVSNETGQFNGVNKQSAICLLAGLVIYTENFRNKLTAEIFQITSDLMKKGADLEETVKNIYNSPTNY